MQTPRVEGENGSLEVLNDPLRVIQLHIQETGSSLNPISNETQALRNTQMIGINVK